MEKMIDQGQLMKGCRKDAKVPDPGRPMPRLKGQGLTFGMDFCIKYVYFCKAKRFYLLWRIDIARN
jgi:hypothetical protein